MRRWWLSLLVSIGLLGWLGRQIDPGELARTLRGIHWPGFFLALAVYLCGLLLRASRYWLVLNRPIGFWPLILVTQVRGMLADLLPAKVGSVSYLYLVTKRYGAGISDALSSFISVFFLDLAALAPLLGLAVLSLPGEAGASSFGPLLLLVPVLLVGSVTGLLLLPWALGHLVGLLARRSSSRLLQRLDEVRDQLVRLRSRGVLWPAFGLSLGVRLAKYGSYYFLLSAVLHNHPDAPPTLPFLRTILGIMGAELSSALPVGGLGGFGTYELAWSIGFGALGFSRSLAAVSGIATHLLSQLVDYGLGIAALLVIYHPPTRWRSMKAVAIGGILLGLAAGIGGLSRFQTRTVPPEPGHPLAADQETGAFRRAAERIGKPAALIWSSNRSGNHEIYRIDLPGGEARALTADPHVDYFGHFSPDGRRILFLRSREPYVSPRDPTNWDVWLMESDGRNAARIVEKGNGPSWWPDGESFVYTRDWKLIRHYLKDGREEVIADGHQRPFGGSLETPWISPDARRVALTIRGPWRGVAQWVIGSPEMALVDQADGCCVTWNATGTDLIWVSKGGRGINRFLRAPAKGGEPSLLLDLPGAYSHEYFPRVSNDNRWLVFAAAAEGHEHDRADYEIFLWEIGRPAEAALRLTYHTGNDQWPDLWVEPR